jgi:hypothetical protein
MILQSYLDAQAMQNAQTVEDDCEEDEAELDDVLEMEDEDGNVIRFLLNATIPYHGDEYVLLISEDSCGDIEQDESFIMRKTTDANGNPCYQSLDDEKLIERIYEAYLEQSEER